MKWGGGDLTYLSFPIRGCVKESPSDTGATSKEKTKTNPPRAISPEVARRRMTTPVVAPRSGLNPPPLTLSCHPLRACERTPQNKKLKPLVLPLPRRHAWLAGPPANTCSRNRPQNKRQQHPNHRHSGISAARRGIPPKLRLRCREATERRGRRGHLFLSSDSHFFFILTPPPFPRRSRWGRLCRSFCWWDLRTNPAEWFWRFRNGRRRWGRNCVDGGDFVVN